MMDDGRQRGPKATGASPYPDPNRPPPPPDASMTRKLARLNPLGRALASALTALAEEDEFDLLTTTTRPALDVPAGEATNKGKDDDSSSESSNGSGRKRGRKRARSATGEDDSVDGGEEDIDPMSSTSLPPSNAKVDAKMKEHLLQTFGDAVASTDWYGTDTNPSISSSSNSTVLQRNEQQRHTSPAIPPPAALLRGKVRHYNRVGGQWRILAKDVEIRPRVGLEVRGKSTWKRADRQSLWDRSLEEEEERGPAAAGAGAGAASATENSADSVTAAESSSKDSNLEGLGLDIDGNTIKVKGDVLILAYDDV